jgi:outer membrane protein OmpA-like peptidoglycan-associated protein
MAHRWVCWLVVAGLGGGCSKTFILEETKPVQVSAKRPEKEPEPPPKKEEPPKRVEVKEDVVDVKETIAFEFSGWGLAKDSHDILDEVAKVLNQHPELKKIRVEGHTDTQGGYNENVRLSQKRANNVVKYLVSQGVDAKRLFAEGFGPNKPIADNNSDEGRAKNRRVVFAIVEKTKVEEKKEPHEKKELQEKKPKEPQEKKAKEPQEKKAKKDTKKDKQDDEESAE